MSEFVRLGDHITIAKGKPPAQLPFDGPGASLYLTPEYLRGRALALPAKPSTDAVTVDDGDAVLLWDGSNAGEFFHGKAGLAASTMARLRSDDSLDRGYLVHALKHLEPTLKGQTSGTGIPHVDREVLEGFRLFRPAALEQTRIAEVLDTLDTTIRQTEAIIKKLKQVKQGLLHDLLTRGIDTNGELRPQQSQAPHLYKESPLGWIPKVWDVPQVHAVATLVTSGSRGWAMHYSESGALFVRSQNVRMGYLDFNDRQHVTPPMGSEGQRTRLEPCDLLITITGNGVGNVGHVPEQWHETAFVSQHVGLIRLRDPVLAPLAMHYLVQGAPGNQQLIDAQYGQSKPGLNLENLRELRVPVPPAAERLAIVERVACVYTRIEHEDKFATQLRALKAGLMDDLLTGRVRVFPSPD